MTPAVIAAAFPDPQLKNLNKAIRSPDIPSALLAIEKGGKALANVRDSQGCTPLYYACRDGACVAVVNALIVQGADVNAAILCPKNPLGPWGATPLWAAANLAENIALAIILLRKGAIPGAECTKKGLEIIKQAELHVKHGCQHTHSL